MLGYDGSEGSRWNLMQRYRIPSELFLPHGSVLYVLSLDLAYVLHFCYF